MSFRQRDAIEAAYGRPLEWERLDNRKASRIGEYAPGDVAQSAEHDRCMDFFIDAGERLRRALGHLV